MILKQWVDTHFARVTLKSLGLRLQLGHAIGDHCCNPKRAFGDEFVVINTNGIHDVALDFCGCGMAQTHVKQLLRAHLFPATIFDPKTAATFEVLEKYQLLSFESKASSYEYYQCLVRLTDNVGINPPKVNSGFLYLHVQITILLVRIDTLHSCASFMNGDTSRCSSALVRDTTPVV